MSVSKQIRVDADDHPDLGGFLKDIRRHHPRLEYVEIYSSMGGAVLDVEALPAVKDVTLTQLFVVGTPEVSSETRSLILHNVAFANFTAFVDKLGGLERLSLVKTPVDNIALLARLPLRSLTVAGSTDWVDALPALLRAPFKILNLHLPSDARLDGRVGSLDLSPTLERLWIDSGIRFKIDDVRRVLREHKNIDSLNVGGYIVNENAYLWRHLVAFLFAKHIGTLARRVATFLLDVTIPPLVTT